MKALLLCALLLAAQVPNVLADGRKATSAVVLEDRAYFAAASKHSLAAGAGGLPLPNSVLARFKFPRWRRPLRNGRRRWRTAGRVAAVTTALLLLLPAARSLVLRGSTRLATTLLRLFAQRPAP